MKRIEFGEFHTTDAHREAITRVLDSNWLTIGKVTKEFEKKLAEILGAKHCVSMSSGTSADTAACILVGELKGFGEIICPALTFIASVEAIQLSGHHPVLVDVGIDMQMNMDLVERAITPMTKALMCVNLMGRPCELDKARAICDKYNLILIVDNCESYYSTYQGKKTIDFADIETTSHFTAHIIFGVENGTCLTNNDEYARLLRGIRSHGRLSGHQFIHELFGSNYKPSDLHAAIGLVELDKFHNTWATRVSNYQYIDDKLKSYKDIFWALPLRDGDKNAPHGYSIILKEYRHVDYFKKKMEEANIHIKRNFGAIHRHKPYSYLLQEVTYPYEGSFPFPIAEIIGDQGFHIGVHQYLTYDDLVYITDTITGIFNNLTM